MDINVIFMHPTDGRLLTVKLDNTITSQEAIAELIAADFIPAYSEGYSLAIKGGAMLNSTDSFKDKSVDNEAVIRIIPATDAGGIPVSDIGESLSKKIQNVPDNKTGIPGLDGSSIKRFSVEQVMQSEAATVMLINMYDDLHLRHEKAATELDYVRSKSRDRFVSSILLLISQIVIAIGVNLLNTQLVAGVTVIVAGSLQAALALYFTFRSGSGK